MATLLVGLIICGFICIVISYVMSGTDEEKQPTQQSSATLTEAQMEAIRKQINDVIEQELEDIGERTEGSLDHISNTKILEMNEYADTILEEINKNHNETVFLYDMLNQKAKEVKSTVKDVNLAKYQVDKIKELENSQTPLLENTLRDLESETQALEETDRRTNNQAENLDHMVNEEKTRQQNVSNESSDYTCTEEMDVAKQKKLILELSQKGLSAKQIAQQLNLGVGEVKLVVDLFDKTKI